MDSIQTKRITIISIGVVFVAIGILFLTPLLAPSQYSDEWILSGTISIVIGFIYPFPKMTAKKPRQWYERAPSLEDTEGGRTGLAGIIIILSGLIFGFLAYAFGSIGYAIVIGGLLLLVGLVVLVIGAVLRVSETLKETQ